MLDESTQFDRSIDRIADQAVSDQPFPHFYVEDVFSADVFAKIHEHWPTTEHFHSALEDGGMEPQRFYFHLRQEEIKKLDPEGRVFWESVATWLTSARLLDAALSKYGDRITSRLTEMFGASQWTAARIATLTRFNTSLVWDVTGYSLLPHADDPRVLLNYLFYLPLDDSQRDLGTTIYAPKDPDYVSHGEARHHREYFTALKTFPYLPNSMFSFVRTPRSFHGMEGVHTERTTRKLMVYSLMLNDQAMDAANPEELTAAVAG